MTIPIAKSNDEADQVFAVNLSCVERGTKIAEFTRIWSKVNFWIFILFNSGSPRAIGSK